MSRSMYNNKKAVNTILKKHIFRFILQNFKTRNNFNRWLSNATGGDKLTTAWQAKKDILAYSKQVKLSKQASQATFNNLERLASVNGSKLFIYNLIEVKLIPVNTYNFSEMKHAYKDGKQFSFIAPAKPRRIVNGMQRKSFFKKRAEMLKKRKVNQNKILKILAELRKVSKKNCHLIQQLMDKEGNNLIKQIKENNKNNKK